jgi:hypothetical protein
MPIEIIKCNHFDDCSGDRGGEDDDDGSDGGGGGGVVF